MKSDLQKTVADAQCLLGQYAAFAQQTQDKAVKKMFNELSDDMQKHIDTLNLRLDYLTKNNPMYQREGE